jgi:hypothetical protein
MRLLPPSELTTAAVTSLPPRERFETDGTVEIPPTECPTNRRQQGEGQVLHHGHHDVFALPENVNIRRPAEREDDHGNAILEKHERSAALAT